MTAESRTIKPFVKSVVVDTPVDSLLRGRHVERLLALAEDYEDRASEFALSGNPARAWYLEDWAGRMRQRAMEVSWEPMRKLQTIVEALDG